MVHVRSYRRRNGISVRSHTRSGRSRYGGVGFGNHNRPHHQPPQEMKADTRSEAEKQASEVIPNIKNNQEPEKKDNRLLDILNTPREPEYPQPKRNKYGISEEVEKRMAERRKKRELETPKKETNRHYVEWEVGEGKFEKQYFKSYGEADSFAYGRWENGRRNNPVEIYQLIGGKKVIKREFPGK